MATITNTLTETIRRQRGAETAKMYLSKEEKAHFILHGWIRLDDGSFIASRYQVPGPGWVHIVE